MTVIHITLFLSLSVPEDYLLSLLSLFIVVKFVIKITLFNLNSYFRLYIS